MGNPTPSRIYGPGEAMPKYTLFPPANPNVASLSTTVGAPTRLSGLVGPGGGTVHWAACLGELDWLTW
ncbi:MAG: putative adhesin [Kineosporiaceae bacterium]